MPDPTNATAEVDPGAGATPAASNANSSALGSLGTHRGGTGQTTMAQAKENLAPAEDSKRFMKRVEQLARKQAADEAKKALGMSLEEAKAKLAEMTAAPPATKPSADASSETKKIAAERDRLAKERQQLQQKLQKATHQAQRRERELRNEIIQGKVIAAARDSGVAPTALEYAAFQFAQAQAGSSEELDPAQFFTGLKTTQPHIYGAAPPPPPTPATTAPPASAVPGGAPPAPVSAGTPPKETNAADLPQEDFIQQTAEKFGFRMPRY